MPFTTGWVTNTRDFGTAATNIVVNMLNADSINTATIIVEVFGSVDSATFVPVYVQSFILAPNASQVMTFLINGNVAYEVEYDVISPITNNVVLSVFGIDEFGNLVTSQKYATPDFTFIPELSLLV